MSIPTLDLKPPVTNKRLVNHLREFIEWRSANTEVVFFGWG